MKRLLRSTSNRMLCGVCGGIAEYAGIDATLVRLVWAVLACVTIGTAVIAYIIAAVIIPTE